MTECPQCGGRVRREGRCGTCLECGASTCSNGRAGRFGETDRHASWKEVYNSLEVSTGQHGGD